MRLGAFLSSCEGYPLEIMSKLPLRLHDTLSGELRQLVPKDAGKVGIYNCGPTTYDAAHIGHARAALAPDLLVRHLRTEGIEVNYVRNITDVDDKILKRATESGEPPMELSARMAVLYQEDMAKLGCVDPDVQPKVSEHISQIIELVSKLIGNEAAYVADMPNGVQDVYYAVRRFEGYGKLSKRKIADLRVGARVEASAEKRDPLDFALWKGCGADEWGWDSPWGRGRPGWHIECSAMSAAYLGHGFDVHCGGLDLIFPHHENEIAQSEAAEPDGGDFVGIWIHNGFVTVDKEKMAKSLGNFVTIGDVYQRYDSEALRYFLMTVHYRKPISFDTDKLDDGRVVFAGIAEAERRMDYLYGTVERLTELIGDENGQPDRNKLAKELRPMLKLFEEARGRARDALNEDLNTPVVLAVIADVAKHANEICDLALKRRKDARFVTMARQVAVIALSSLRSLFDLIGLMRSEPEAYRRRTQAQRIEALGLTVGQVDDKIAAREQARLDKAFEKADELRAELAALGIELADSPTGTVWRAQVV